MVLLTNAGAIKSWDINTNTNLSASGITLRWDLYDASGGILGQKQGCFYGVCPGASGTNYTLSFASGDSSPWVGVHDYTTFYNVSGWSPIDSGTLRVVV